MNNKEFMTLGKVATLFWLINSYILLWFCHGVVFPLPPVFNAGFATLAFLGVYFFPPKIIK